METRLFDNAEAAATLLRGGGLVAFPTETVYGLGGDATRADVAQRIFAAKGRPSDNPLIVHIADRGQLEQVCLAVPDAARALMDAFWPGPLTLVLPKHPDIPSEVTAGLASVGVRLPSHPVARRFLEACDTPVAAPSANRSGRPSPTDWAAVNEDLDGRIDGILKGGSTQVGLESTVVDVCGDAPVILRSGSITLEQLQQVVAATRYADPQTDAVHRSPGTRHRHYAPRATVRWYAPGAAGDPSQAAYIGLTAPQEAWGYEQVCPDVQSYAARLFAFFRHCDRIGIRTVYCESVEDAGLGIALMDRIRRAIAR